MARRGVGERMVVIRVGEAQPRRRNAKEAAIELRTGQGKAMERTLPVEDGACAYEA